MGREIRQVPMNWEHSKKNDGQYQPLFDESYEKSISEWIKNHILWLKNKHPDQSEYPDHGCKYYAEWNGNAPDIDYYRPEWTEEQKKNMGIAVYETVSEGTPVTPIFKTKEELKNYLINHGTYWNPEGYSEQAAENFVNNGWSPSGIMVNGNFKPAIECCDIIEARCGK